jgi:hypothetical protein
MDLTLYTNLIRKKKIVKTQKSTTTLSSSFYKGTVSDINTTFPGSLTRLMQSHEVLMQGCVRVLTKNKKDPYLDLRSITK